jgi:hypothetical protein
MAAHEALRHEPAVGRPQHMRRPHTLGVEDACQSVEELRRGGHVRIVRCDDPVAVLEGRHPREDGLADHRSTRQEKEHFLPLTAGDVVPARSGHADALGRMCCPELP